MIFASFNRLNRHTKVALFIAPILVILGFAASDLWLENQAMKTRLFEMQPESSVCDVASKNCVLISGEFKISVYVEKGLTTLNSTFPLDTATLFLVNEEQAVKAYPMDMKDTPYYWHQTTPLPEKLASSGSQTLRLIASVKGGQYFAEFTSQSQTKSIR